MCMYRCIFGCVHGYTSGRCYSVYWLSIYTYNCTTREKNGLSKDGKRGIYNKINKGLVEDFLSITYLVDANTEMDPYTLYIS